MAKFALIFLSLFTSAAFADYDNSVPPGYVDGLLRGTVDYYFSEINRGWFDEQYAPLKARIDPSKSYIVLHNRLPSTTLDLRTPNGFRTSIFNAGLLSIGSLDIGHVMMGWHCNVNGQVFEGNTAITGEQQNQQVAMAKGGWGLTGLFSIFKDGHIQTPVLVRSVFHRAVEKNRAIATLAFEVEPMQCAQMLNFLHDFLTHENKPFTRFGLNADPLKFEGGGCGSFATSAISTSGAINEFFPHLWRTMKATPNIFGYGLDNLPTEIDPFPVPHAPGEKKSIGWVKALFLADWNPGSKPPMEMRLMDPEMLYLAQETIFRQSLDDLYTDNLEFARRMVASTFVRPRILKEEPVQQQEAMYLMARMPIDTPVNEKFDSTAARVVSGAKQWFVKMKQKGYTAKGFDFNGHPAVLISR
ncbi:MAG TPA: hypothetical protein VIH99_11860 [Bdellovibrionota bacterium]|jgi:hypothetical protein